jgi:predicted  nucleic acid-binding Zn-ribbon protein
MNHDSRSFEDELSSAKADVAVIRTNYVTKADLQEVRIELKSEIHAVRSELRADIHAVRSELKADVQAVRTDLKEEIGGLKRDFERLRVEIQAVRAEFYKAIDAQTWKLIGSAAALVTVVYFVVRAGY